jgi:hypothetical protein
MCVMWQWNICSMFSKIPKHSLSFVLRSFQYRSTNLRRTVEATDYPEANERFHNTNFSVLLIMQFNKVLITPTPHTIPHNGKKLSVTQNLASLRHILSSGKATYTKQSWTVQSFSVTSHCGTLFPYEHKRIRTKGTVGESLQFYDFPL